MLDSLIRHKAMRLSALSGWFVPADDLAQEGAIAAWLSSLKSTDADRQRNGYVAARSAMIDLLRAANPHRADALPEDHEIAGPDDTEATVIRREEARMVAEEIERLPAIQQRVLADYLAGTHQAVTARALKITAPRVSQILDRAVKALARSVAILTADAKRLRAGVPVEPLSPQSTLAEMFSPDIVRGVTPGLLQ